MQWEYQLLLLINNTLSAEWLDRLMLFITGLADHGEVWIFIGALLLIKKSTRRTGITVLVALATGFLVGNLLLKQIVARPRPFDVYPIELILAPPADYSFPSGHTLASFESAFAVWLKSKKLGAALLVLASLIAFSRLYLMVHYPTDVLFGVILGLGIAYFAGYIVDKNFGGAAINR